MAANVGTRIERANSGGSLLPCTSPVMAPSSGRGMSAIPPLSGGKQKSGERVKNDASDPNAK